MKKVIPFNKTIEFNSDIYEINSISLEHNLNTINNQITGDIIISGDYKESDNSLLNEPFIFNIPICIDLDSKYDTSNIKIEIEDFNYDLISNNKLDIDVRLNIDNLEEIELIEEPIIEKIEVEEEKEEKEELINNDYVTYHVHIYREKDSIESILNTYKISKEDLEEYNNLNDITIGSKVIIPSNEL